MQRDGPAGHLHACGFNLPSLTIHWLRVPNPPWPPDREASVACRHMGLSSFGYAVPNAAFGRGTGPVLWDDVQCFGNETRLTQCKRAAADKVDCFSHKEDVRRGLAGRSPVGSQPGPARRSQPGPACSSRQPPAGMHSLSNFPQLLARLYACRWAWCAAAASTPRLITLVRWLVARPPFSLAAAAAAADPAGAAC